MEHATVSPRVYRFGSFELSVEAVELRKNGVRLKLQDQPFHVLRTLLEHPGELVPREQLRQQLWPEGTFVDFEHGLNTAIKKLRDVLSDDADTPRYIETVPRKGYRFLVSVTADPPLPASPATPSYQQPRKWRKSLLLAALGIAIVVVVLLLLRGLFSQPYLRITATRQLTFAGDLSPYSTIETDGRRVYYFKYGDGHLYSVSVSGGSESSSATNFTQPVILHISPDGSLLLVKEMLGLAGEYQARLWLLPTNGGPARPLGDIDAESAAWTPDGKTIAFARHNAIYLTEDQGATHHQFVGTPERVSWMRWSPDGQRLRFTLFDARTFASSTWETQRNGKISPVVLKPGSSLNACCGIWTRDGRDYLFQEFRDERTDYWITRDGWAPFRSGKAFPVGGGGLEMVAAAASPFEDTLFVVGHQASRMAFEYDLKRHKLTPFLPEFSIQNPGFSPDGKWMALCQAHTKQIVLWRARYDGSEWIPLTDAGLRVHHAQFSPDGRRITLMAKRPNSPWKVYWVSAEGGALHELNVPVASQGDPNWMLDNESILFGQPPRSYAEPDSPRAIYVHNVQTGSISKVPGSEGWFSPRLSPDGRKFLALSIDEHKLAVYDFTDAQWRTLVENPQQRMIVPSWSPDGEWAYANKQYGKNNSVIRVRVNGGIAEDVLSFPELIPSPECWAWSFTPNGSLLLNCVRPNSNIYALHYE